MKRCLSVLVAMAITAPALAAGPSRGGGFGWFGPFVSFNDFGGLNQAFAGAGIADKLESTHWMMGGGGHALVDRIVIGGSGWAGTQVVASESLRARVEIGGGAFNVGYSLVSMKHLIVAPVLGIGGGGYTVELQKLTPTPGSFEDLLANPGRTSKVSFSSLQVAPQLMVTVPISFVGIQLIGGYSYTPMSPEWELSDGGSLNRGPAIAKGVPFAGLSVVFGGFGESRKHRKHKHEDRDEDED